MIIYVGVLRSTQRPLNEQVFTSFSVPGVWQQIQRAYDSRWGSSGLAALGCDFLPDGTAVDRVSGAIL